MRPRFDRTLSRDPRAYARAAIPAALAVAVFWAQSLWFEDTYADLWHSTFSQVLDALGAFLIVATFTQVFPRRPMPPGLEPGEYCVWLTDSGVRPLSVVLAVRKLGATSVRPNQRDVPLVDGVSRDAARAVVAAAHGAGGTAHAVRQRTPRASSNTLQAS